MEPVQPAATAPAPLPPPEEEVKQGTEEMTAPVAAISEAHAHGEQRGAVETETGAASMMEEGQEEREGTREGEHEEEGWGAYHVLHTVLNLIERMKKKNNFNFEKCAIFW